MKLKVNDCLKYWRVIRYFIKSKYGLTTADLDVLLFLYSEDIFSKEKFDEFDNLLSWDEDRFDRLLRDGWIEVFRKNQKKYKTLYDLSFKTQRVISSIYKKPTVMSCTVCDCPLRTNRASSQSVPQQETAAHTSRTAARSTRR